LIRVTDRQKRAKATFTKPLTTHLTRGKGDFSCRGSEKRICGLSFEFWSPHLIERRSKLSDSHKPI